MKHVIMEADGRKAVAMREDGQFVTIRDRGYAAGQRLETLAGRKPRGISVWTKAVGAIAAALIVTAGAAAYAIPYTEMSLDVNPSIELRLNWFNRVISAGAVNGDAERVMDRLHLFNCDLATATERIASELAAQGYVDAEEEAQILLTSASGDTTRAREMLRTMTATMERTMERLRVRAEIFGECVSAEVQTRAREYGTTPGKLLLVEQYMLSTGDPGGVDIGEWLDKPVREIKAAIAMNGADPENGWSSAEEIVGNGYAGGDGSDNGYGGATPGTTDPGYHGGDKDDNGYGGNTLAPNDTGYSGGDKSDNGYGGATPGSTDPGYAGGDQSDNGYGGGDPTATPGQNGGPGGSESGNGTATPGGSGNGAGNH
jgi:hypothetical protein